MLCISTTQRSAIRILLVSVMLAGSPWTPGLCAGQNWPSFRGASAAGVAEGYPTPTTWDLKSGEKGDIYVVQAAPLSLIHI